MTMFLLNLVSLNDADTDVGTSLAVEEEEEAVDEAEVEVAIFAVFAVFAAEVAWDLPLPESILQVGQYPSILLPCPSTHPTPSIYLREWLLSDRTSAHQQQLGRLSDRQHSWPQDFTLLSTEGVDHTRIAALAGQSTDSDSGIDVQRIKAFCEYHHVL